MPSFLCNRRLRPYTRGKRLVPFALQSHHLSSPTRQILSMEFLMGDDERPGFGSRGLPWTGADAFQSL